MATPHRRTNSSASLNAGPSRTLLQQLLEEINGSSPKGPVRSKSTPHGPASTQFWSSPQTHSPSVWVGGSTFAHDAREKLRAADEIRFQKPASNACDGALELPSPTLNLNTVGPYAQESSPGECDKGKHRTPDPIRSPHDYMQYMMAGSPMSTGVGVSPTAESHDGAPFHLQNPSSGNNTGRALSPLIFSDPDTDESSWSPQTQSTASPTEVPPSATTVCTADEARTPSDEGTVHSSKRVYFPDNSTPDASPKKKRTMPLPNIHSDAYSQIALEAADCFIGVGGETQCVLQGETFTERAPTPRMSTASASRTTDALPELSSFRPIVADAQGQPARSPSSRRLARAFTSPVQSPNSTLPDTPAWMRPMHLIDTGGRSIYFNAHDDGPIRHALCLYCFRMNGGFRKVHKHGYEACGRTEVLDSHYWESCSGQEESSDDSDVSDY